MKELAKLVLVVTVIAVISGLLLGATYHVTKDPIEKAKRQEFLDGLKRVLPEFDNAPDQDVLKLEENGKGWTFHIARKGGAIVGVAFACRSDRGYGGAIELLAGVLPEGRLNTFEVLAHSETPGLGALIATPEFKKQFQHRDIEKTVWAVKKDRGDIDAVTGATISSRAVVEAIKTGLDLYRKHAAEIAASGRK